MNLFLCEGKIIFHSQDIQIFLFLVNSQTSKSVTSLQISLHIRSYFFNCFFKILGKIKMEFCQKLAQLYCENWKLQSWTKLLRQNRKFLSEKNPSPPKSILFAKFWVFDNKTWPDSTLIQRDKGENLEFEKLNYLLDLLDFQILSQKVLSRVVVSDTFMILIKACVRYFSLFSKEQCVFLVISNKIL